MATKMLAGSIVWDLNQMRCDLIEIETDAKGILKHLGCSQSEIPIFFKEVYEPLEDLLRWSRENCAKMLPIHSPMDSRTSRMENGEGNTMTLADLTEKRWPTELHRIAYHMRKRRTRATEIREAILLIQNSASDTLWWTRIITRMKSYWKT